MTKNYIFNFFNNREKLYGQRYGIENISFLMKKMNDIHSLLKVIHVAGTNGKGSVVSFLSSVLKYSGLKVGIFCSPCFENIFDMYKINCKNINQKVFAKYFKEVENIVLEIEKYEKVVFTCFEIQVVIAFLLFYKEKCDVVILETGCGGLLDATNIIKNPLVSVITSISLDHKNILGENLEQISFHKCGIIKKESLVVTISTQKKKVLKIIEQECLKKKSLLSIVEIDDVSDVKYSTYYQKFSYKGEVFCTKKMIGTFQIENALLTIKTIDILCENKLIDIDKKKIKKGLLMATNNGRFEVLKNKHLFVLDGAHNPSAAKFLKESLDIFFKQKKRIFIFGMFKDKDISSFSKILFKNAFKILTVPLLTSRGESVKVLANIIRETNDNVIECENIDEAIKYISEMECENSVIIACGSISFLHFIKNKICKNNKKCADSRT